MENKRIEANYDASENSESAQYPECSILDIAPTIGAILGIGMPKAEGRAIEDIVDKLEGAEHILLIIVDSLGFSTYRKFITRTPVLDSKNPDKQGDIDKLAFRCRYFANHTTPAIASILTGVCPQIHRIAKTGDVYKSQHETVLEVANSCGIKSAIVIENEGADAMRSKVHSAMGVADSRNIIDYDTQIKNEAVKCLQGEIQLVTIHFRALDRFAHEGRTDEELGYAASTIDRHIGDILGSVSDVGVIVCGDHPIHLNNGESEEHVALITLRVLNDVS